MSTLYYLISSLPTLSLWEKPEIDLNSFLELCKDQLDINEYNAVKEIEFLPSEDLEKQHKNLSLKKWYNWETCLRNKVAKLRTNNTDKDCTSYLHEEKDYFPEIERISQEAMGADNPLDKEKILDNGRWERLCELESGHIFDIDLVFIYKLKLFICEKWLTRQEDAGRENLDKALDELYKEDLLSID